MASTTVVCRRRRFRWGLFLVSMWLLLARARINFPVPVRLNRFAAARLVFILGIAFSITPDTKPGLQFKNSPLTPGPFLPHNFGHAFPGQPAGFSSPVGPFPCSGTYPGTTPSKVCPNANMKFFFLFSSGRCVKLFSQISATWGLKS
jgi:hypothetical protein